MIPSMANGQWFFRLSQQQQRFYHEILWSDCHFPYVLAYMYMVSINAECLPIVHDCLHVLKFPKTKKIMLNSKFHGSAIHKNWISWKFSPINIFLLKISVFAEFVIVCKVRVFLCLLHVCLLHICTVYTSASCVDDLFTVSSCLSAFSCRTDQHKLSGHLSDWVNRSTPNVSLKYLIITDRLSFIVLQRSWVSFGVSRWYRQSGRGLNCSEHFPSANEGRWKQPV